MSSSTVTIRPNGLFNGGGSAPGVVVGTAFQFQATSDESDSTYIGPALAGDGTFSVTFGATGLTEFDHVVSVVLRARVEFSAGGSGANQISMRIYDPVRDVASANVKELTHGTPTTQQYANITTLGGQRLTGSMLDGIVVYGIIPVHTRLYEVYLDVIYNESPSVSVLTPSGTIGIATPIFTWDYTDLEGDPQEYADFLIYPADVVASQSMGATTPSLNPFVLLLATYQQFDRITGLQTYQPGIPITPGDYRIYIRAGDQGGGTHRGPWDSADFTIALIAPAVPAVVVSRGYDDLFGRISVQVQGFDNLLSHNAASAENATSDYTLVNCTAILDTDATKLWSPPGGPIVSTKSLKITASSAANMSAQTASAVFVFAGQAVLAGAHVFSTTERLAFATITWRDFGGSTLSTTVGRSTPTPAGSAPAVVAVYGVAPAGAVSVKVTITIVGPANAEVHWIDDWFLVPARAGAMTNAHLWNENLVANTSFEDYAGSGGASDWDFVTNGAGQTVAVDATQGFDGTQSLELKKDEASLAQPYAQWPALNAGVPRLPVTAGDVVIVSGWQLSTITSGQQGHVYVRALYQDSTSDTIDCLLDGADGVWEPFIAAFKIPTGKTSVSFRFFPASPGSTTARSQINLDVVNIRFANATANAKFTTLGGVAGFPMGSDQLPGGIWGLAVPNQVAYPWEPGGFVVGLRYVVERSVDGGSTWSPVRGVAAVAGAPDFLVNTVLVSTILDYEAPPGSTVMYRASTVSSDPVTSGEVRSAPSAPLLTDPGFEAGQWIGSATDAAAMGYQPPTGARVGALDGVTSGSHLTSPVIPLPGYVPSLVVRLLARSINNAAAQIVVTFLDASQRADELADFGGATIQLPATPGDSGWAWYQATLAIPPFASYMQLSVAQPAALDVTRGHLFLLDDVGVWVGDAAGLFASATTPDCLQWLKDPLNPAANLKVEVEVTNITGSGNASAAGTESNSTEPQVVLQPSGRPDAVVIADDVITDETFPALQFIFGNDAEYIAFENLRRSHHTLLVQFPYGDLFGEQHYVRLGAVRTHGRVQSQDQNRSQKHRVTIEAVEVAAP